MSKDFNPDNYVYFSILPSFKRNASVGFVLSYFDNKLGDQFTFTDNSRYKNPVRYKFNKSLKTLKINNNNKDLVEAIRNHPLCEGSYNGHYREYDGKKIHTNAMFKELNEQGDAKVVLEGFALKQTAVNEGFELIKNPDKAYDALVVLGISSRGDLGHQKLLQYASSEPENFLKQIKSLDFKARALVKKAIDLDILYRDGVIYRAGEIEFGVDIEEAIKEVAKDEVKRGFLERRVNGTTESKEDDAEKTVK